MTKRYRAFWMVLLCCGAFAILAGPKEEGEAIARMLQQKGYPDESASLMQIEKEFKTQPENMDFEAQNKALSESFNQEYDGGRKGEDPLKSHLSHKVVERGTTTKTHQPSLKESQAFVSQKHRFKIADNDPVLDKETVMKRVLEEHPLDPEGKILKAPTQTKTPANDRIMTCRQSAPQSVASCTKRLVVRAIPQAPLIKTVTAHFTAQCFNLVSFSVNLKTGAIVHSQCESPGPTDFWVDQPLGEDPNLSRATVELISGRNISEAGVRFDPNPIRIPSVANGFSVGLTAFQPKTGKRHRANEHHSRGGHYVWRFTIPQDPLLEEHWEGCEAEEALHATQACVLQGSEQADMEETRTLEGYPHPVKRPHWTENRRYLCGPETLIDTCEALLKQVCTQIDSRCSLLKDGICMEYENTFNCSPPDYTKEIGLGIDQGKLSFLSTDQADNTGFEAGDFGHASAHLSALLEMAKTGEEGLGGVRGTKDNPLVFQGSCKECRVNLGSFLRDCCKLKGLLQGLLGGCNQDERNLAIAALTKKRCVKIEGRYCKHKKLGICLEKRDAYCCYGSQIARIIQEIAHQQLGLSYGTAENPACHSLSAEQLGRLNFDTPYARAKLSEIMGDAQANASQTFKAAQANMSQCDLDQKVKALEEQAKAQGQKLPVFGVIPSKEVP